MIIYKESSLYDLPQISNLYNQMAYELRKTTNDPYFNFDILSDNLVLERLQKIVLEDNIKIFVAKYEENIIGFISGIITNCFLPISKVDKIGYIEAAYTMKRFRKNGVMTKLEEKLIEYFRDCGLKYVELSVLSNNSQAKHFWNKSNYVTFREKLRKQL